MFVWTSAPTAVLEAVADLPTQVKFLLPRCNRVSVSEMNVADSALDGQMKMGSRKPASVVFFLLLPDPGQLQRAKWTSAAPLQIVTSSQSALPGLSRRVRVDQ